jgi:hypothetical protein
LSLPSRYRLMQDPTTDVSAYMHWDASGKLLIIPDEQALVENVCKVHFAQKSITSFVRLSLLRASSERYADFSLVTQTEQANEREPSQGLSFFAVAFSSALLTLNA